MMSASRSGISPPQPHKTIACQQLLQEDVTYSGWLRKQSQIHKSFKFVAKVIPWLNKYAVLSKGCMYIFDSDTSRKPSTAYSLYGYNSVNRAGEILQDDAPWAFKLLYFGDDANRVRYFSAASERERNNWMAAVKKQMMYANGKGARLSNKSSRNDDSFSIQEIEDTVYDTTSNVSLGPVDNLSDEEDYNEIDEWDESHPNASVRSSRPLPPIPPNSEDKRVMAKTGRIPSTGHDSKPPVYPPRNQPTPDRAPVRNQPAPPPDNNPVQPPPRQNKRGHKQQLSDDEEYSERASRQDSEDEVFPVRSQPSVAAQGTVDALKAKFNKPLISAKPNIPTGAVSVIPGTKQPPPPRKKNSVEEAGETQNIPSRKCRNDREPLPLPLVRSGPDGTEDPGATVDDNIFWNGTDKEEANRLLNEIGEDGVYLVRRSENNNDQVLVVYAENGARKYKIHQVDGSVYITSEDKFSSVHEMLNYYEKHTLPRRNTCLTKPYCIWT